MGESRRDGGRGVRDERGASAVEYGLIAVAIAAVVAAVVFALGGATLGLYEDTCEAWTANDPNPAVTCE